MRKVNFFLLVSKFKKRRCRLVMPQKSMETRDTIVPLRSSYLFVLVSFMLYV